LFTNFHFGLIWGKIEHNMKFSSKKSKLLIGVLVLILVIFLLNIFQKNVRSFFYSVSAPIQKVLWGVGDRVADFFGAIIKINSLKNELDEEKLENQELLSQIVTLRELKKENKVLREALEIELQKEFKLAFAQIIGKDISQDSILIDKGSEDGISENMPVITQQKALVGKISEVYKNLSKVMLISDKKSSFDAKISVSDEEEKDIPGVVKGKGNFKIMFDLVPREEEVSRGEIVSTTALGGVFPKGLLVGQVKEAKKTDVEPFQEIEIESAFDIKNMETIFVITEF